MAMTNDDMVVASSVCFIIGIFFGYNQNSAAVDLLLSDDVLENVCVVRCRAVGAPQNTTVEWWAVRAEKHNLDTFCYTGPWLVYMYQAVLFCGRGIDIPPALASQWKEIIGESVHIVQMIRAAELSQRTRHACVFFSPYLSLRTLANISSIPSQREALVSPDLVEALLYIVEHDNVFVDLSTAAFASMTAVNLIGRNEGGLTLTQQVVDQVFGIFKSYFDTTSRRSSY
eukprot:COSAG01_NODE_23087_length_828_cov_123.005487_1_plen_227_part_10